MRNIDFQAAHDRSSVKDKAVTLSPFYFLSRFLLLPFNEPAIYTWELCSQSSIGSLDAWVEAAGRRTGSPLSGWGNIS